MICDGIENCVQYIHNFDPEKSQNPFAYFTQIIHYAFLRRIQKEKKQLEIKNKILEKTGFDQVFDDNNTIDGNNYSDYNSIKDAVHSKLRVRMKTTFKKLFYTEQTTLRCHKVKNSFKFCLFHDYFLKFYDEVFFPCP